MRLMIIAAAALSMALYVGGCNKNREKVAELEKEVKQAETLEIKPDSSLVAVSDTVDTASSQPVETARLPERTPDLIPEESTAVATNETTVEKKELTAEPIASMPPHLKSQYTIQVGSGVDREAAQLMVDRFINDGYESFISEKSVENIVHYRVRVGHYETRAEAEKAGAELQSKYSVNYWVDRDN